MSLVRPATWRMGQLAIGTDSTTLMSAPALARQLTRKLTLDNQVLTGSLVPLALPTNLVGQPIALVTKRVEALAPRITFHQLTLLGEFSQKLRRRHSVLTWTNICQPQCFAGVA